MSILIDDPYSQCASGYRYRRTEHLTLLQWRDLHRQSLSDFASSGVYRNAFSTHSWRNVKPAKAILIGHYGISE
jgi:hypothetical protein